MARQSRGYHAARPEAPEPAPPGMAARIVAARLVAESPTLARPLEERLAADLGLRAVGLDPRDRALARSIATVALRRLGTIRKALARRLEKGLPKRGGPLEWTLIVAAAQILFLDVPDHAAVDLAVKATRADPASAPFAALANAVLRTIARERDAILESSDPLNDDTPGWLGHRWRGTYSESTARAIAAAHRAEPTLDISVKSDAEGWAARLGGIVLPTGSVRLDTHAPVIELEGYSSGEWWVQDAAAALPARLLQLCRGYANRRSLRCARRKSRRTRRCRRGSDDGRSLGRAPEAARRQFRAAAPSLGDCGRRRPLIRCAAVRRSAPGRAVHSDRNHPSPSRCRLDQAAWRSPGTGQTSGPIARPGDCAHPLWGSNRLLRLLARTRGGRSADRRRSSP